MPNKALVLVVAAVLEARDQPSMSIGTEWGPRIGVRPWGRTGSGCCFDRLPSVVVLELGGAQIAKG